MLHHDFFFFFFEMKIMIECQHKYITFNPVYNERTKRIEVDRDFIWEKVNKRNQAGVYAYRRTIWQLSFKVLTKRQLFDVCSKTGTAVINAPT